MSVRTALPSTHNLYFEQKHEKYHFFFLSENFQFLEVKCSIFLNTCVFVMSRTPMSKTNFHGLKDVRAFELVCRVERVNTGWILFLRNPTYHYIKSPLHRSTSLILRIYSFSKYFAQKFYAVACTLSESFCFESNV